MENKKFTVSKFEVTATAYLKYEPVFSASVSLLIHPRHDAHVLDIVGQEIESMTNKVVGDAAQFAASHAGQKSLIDKKSKVTVTHKFNRIEYRELRDRVKFREQKPKMIHLPGQGGRPH